MPTITLNSVFASGVSSRMMSYGAVTSDNNQLGLLSSGGGGAFNAQNRTGVISIMKGTVPTNFSALTSYSSRSADILVQWTVPDNNFSASTFDNPSVIITNFKAASATGTATWFWWVTRGFNYQGWSDTIYDQIIGTVELPGTGADLEIPSTSVTTGQLFRIIDLRMQIATSYSY